MRSHQRNPPCGKLKLLLLPLFWPGLFFERRISGLRIFFPALSVLCAQIVLVMLPAMMASRKIPFSVLVAASLVVSIGMIGRCLLSALFFYLAAVALAAKNQGMAFPQFLWVSIVAQSILILGKVAASAIGMALLMIRGGNYAVPSFVNAGSLFAGLHIPLLPLVSMIDIFVVWHILVAARGVAVCSSLSMGKSFCVAAANWIFSVSVREFYVKDLWLFLAP